MFCTNCGQQVPNGSNVCGYCGKRLNMNPMQGQGGYQISQGYTPMQPRNRIDNVFSALVHEKTPGAIMEFSLWCTVCFVVLLSLIAAIVGGGNITWILLMIFSIGMGVIMAFRLKPIAMLCGAGTINLITLIIFFVAFTDFDIPSGYDIFYSPINIILFILTLLGAIGLVTCGFIHFFSRFNLGNILTILSISCAGVTFFLQILMFAAPYFGDYASKVNEAFRHYELNEDGYWIGTICYWLMLAVVTLLYSFFFWGFIDSRKDKIINVSRTGGGYGGNPNYNAGLRGITGMYTGQLFYLQGRTIAIGSGAGMDIMIQDAYVSGRHCMIRFNPVNGCYEIYDDSTNGVYLNNGNRLQKGIYNSVQRGSVIIIGSNSQQFQLL